MATEQILNSEAVDAAVAKIDFTPLRGQLVYFDTKYMTSYKGTGFVNADYVISSLRQQMIAAGLLLQATVEEADYIVEGRVGTLGTDAHEIVYGIPSNSALGSAAAVAASVASGVPASPTIPELSVARRNEQSAAAKIGLFAYSRDGREVVWQSGSSVARATAKDLWVFGVGPFQKGTIYDGKTQFGGATTEAPIAGRREGMNGSIAAFDEEHLFATPRRQPRPLVEKGPEASDAEEKAAVQQVKGERPEPGHLKLESKGDGGVQRAGAESAAPVERGSRPLDRP
jgi:hypothetical protein